MVFPDKVSSLAARYAQALFHTAKQRGILEEVHKDVVYGIKVCSQHPSLLSFLYHPLTVPKEKARLLHYFSQSINLLTMQFLLLVNQKKRNALLPAVVQAFVTLYEKKEKVHRAKVTVAQPLSEATREKLIALIQQIFHVQHVSIDAQIDAAMLGGYILQVGEYRLDASVRTKLNQLLHYWSK